MREVRSRKHNGKKLLLLLLCLFGIVVLGYLAYLLLTYKRIADAQPLEIKSGAKKSVMQTEEAYAAVTYNIGFGAYTPEYTFFMDGGKSSVAESKDSVLATVQGAAEETAAKTPDFILMQEVDLDATRSYHVNQRALLDTAFSAYDSAFAVAYDSAYLLFPPWEPHGKSLSGMATYSRFPMEEAVRYRLPISEDLNKFFDLDRCYSVSKIPVENGKYFCLYHVHLSAYGNDAAIRSAQIATLTADMAAEYAKGNYVLCGGDFNHDMVLSEDAEKAEGWAKPFPREDLPQGFRVAMDLLEEERRGAMVKSTRKADTPYDPETSYLVTVDGFILSDNITLEFLEVEENGFRYSDHHPIRMIFKLKA